jgi:feruloyl esterase
MMHVGDIPNGMKWPIVASANPVPVSGTVQGVADIAEGALGSGSPEFCYVTGTVVTDQATGKTANFIAALPVKSRWNGKFMFQGCGGNCGAASFQVPAALLKGYPIFATDDGHAGNSRAGPIVQIFDTSWAVESPGKRNEGAVDDFFYRAVHMVVNAGKELVRGYYSAKNLSHAYFLGCSDGGREGMVEIARYPTDFDGVLVGDPYFDIGGETLSALVQIQVQLRSRDAALSLEQLRQIDRLVYSKCDATDGVTDGLIQNPARCEFNPAQDLPRCTKNEAPVNCFTENQVRSLQAMLSAITDTNGNVVYPGAPVSDLSESLEVWAGFKAAPDSLGGPEPWATDPLKQPVGWYFADQTARYLIYADQADFNLLRTPGITFQEGGLGGFHAIVPKATLDVVKARSAAGEGDIPSATAEFFRQKRKLIIYHGLSDQDITPFRTIQFYRALARAHGGYKALQKEARLFLVPGMAHCAGGAGPNSFGQPIVNTAPSSADNDIVAALEGWVERDRAPNSILAVKYKDKDPAAGISRSMPLCPFPAMAQYGGRGDVNDAANWRCPPDDQRLLDTGRSGRAAGVDDDLNWIGRNSTKAPSSHAEH